jgi:hypothetical protein
VAGTAGASFEARDSGAKGRLLGDHDRPI